MDKMLSRGTGGARSVKGGPKQKKPMHSSTLGKGGNGGSISMKGGPKGPAARGSSRMMA